MAKKKRKGSNKEGTKNSNDFNKTFTVREFEGHVRFELIVDNLKITSVADLKEKDGDKALFIRGWRFSVPSHKFIFCIHLILEYMKYYSELNKLPLIAELPKLGIPPEYLTEEDKSKRLALTNLYLDHDFQQLDGDPEIFVSVLDSSVHIPKKVDLIGMHYGSSNRLVMGSGGSKESHQLPLKFSDRRPPSPQTPVELPEEVPPAQD